MFIHNTCEDASFAVWRALESIRETGDNLLEFEQGTYHFYPQFATERVSCVSNHDYDGFKFRGLPIDGFKGLTVDGHGADFIFHDVMLPVDVWQSENITLKNFSIDYPIPHYAHATVTDAGADFLTMKIWDISPYVIENNRLLFRTEPDTLNPPYFFLDIDPETDTYREGTTRILVRGMSAREENGLVTLYGLPLTCIPHPGDTVCFHLDIRYAAGVFIDHSKNVTLENVILHHALGMGVQAQVSENITLDRVQITPSKGRYVSVTDDGAHFVCCRGDIVLKNCLFEKHFDDTLNCHGIYMRIDRFLTPDRRTVLLRLVHKQQLGVECLHPGERVELVNHVSLLSQGTNTVKSIRSVSRSLSIAEFAEPIPDCIREMDCVESLDAVPNLTVTGCRFFAAFPRGLLITTRGRVRIENNYFRVASAAIHISGDTNNWFESGCVRDVLIRNNTFDHCGIISPKFSRNHTVINIVPEIARPSAADGFFHENIRVEHNRFFCAGPDVLKAVSVRGLVFRDNDIDIPDPRYTIVESEGEIE